FDPALGRNVEAAVIARADLAPGEGVEGPALVVERETTVVVPASRMIVALADGTLEMRRKEESDG
ncbi:MAG: hypothetical protein D6811_07865, partial [Alphaproteobacteria bacterium]